MPKRNRTQEVKRHGRLLGEAPLPPVSAKATPEGMRQFGSLALWAQRYVNYIYEHGGTDGQQLDRLGMQPVRWRVDGGFSQSTFRVEGRGVRRAYSDNPDALYLSMCTGMVIPTMSIDTREVLDLVIDGGAIKAGHYDGSRAAEAGLPGPIGFESVEEAYEAGVTVRAVHLLGRFRDIVLNPPGGLRIENVLRRDIYITPPVELQRLPAV